MKPEDRYDSLIRFYSDKSGFTGKDWFKFKAQIKAESNFDSQAVSPVGAKGLGQFMDPTWGDWGKGDPFNPEANIDAQVRYMKRLLDRLTTWELAWAAYNWGIGNVLKIWTDPQWKTRLPTETQNYLQRITQYFKEYTS